MKEKIIIIGGDPNSVNSEIIYKSWKKINKSLRKKIFLITNISLFQRQLNKLNYSIKLKEVKNIYEKIKTEDLDKLKIINLHLKFKKPFNVPEKDSSKFVISSLNLGHKIALSANVKGLINCPINKKLLKKEKIGVTEYLSSKCKIRNNSEVMLIKNEKLGVSPITTHIDVNEVSKKIKKEIIVNKVKTIIDNYKKYFGFNPKIGIMGLNPHNAEFRSSSKEKKEIIPAINKLRKIGIKVDGPLVSDTIFINDYKNYDVLVGMYHDQVLGPFKALFKFNAINVTLGLKYLRLSPDHGTAVRLINKNTADPTSLIKCIEFLNKNK